MLGRRSYDRNKRAQRALGRKEDARRFLKIAF